MSEICNHVAALLFRVDAAVTLGLTNPACTSKPNDWLPNRTEVKPAKIEDIIFDRHKFEKTKKKKRSMVSRQGEIIIPCQNVN